jgi:hypothetical protein
MVASGDRVQDAPAGAASSTTLGGDGEEARARRRAVDTLLQISQRMALLAMDDCSLLKLKGELGGMSAWISAFTCQLAGIPVELTPLPGGELLLASLEVLPHTEKLVDGRAALPFESASYEYRDAASRSAAMALALVGLASEVAARAGAQSPDSESARRHREAERRLALRLDEAVALYERDLDPDRDLDRVPEGSFHGSGGVD